MNSKLEKVILNLSSPILRSLGKKKIFITCTPKSASTYLMRLLAGITNSRVTTFISAYDRTEQDINMSKIVESSFFSTVTHQHMKCSSYNLKILSKYRIKPIILTRDIYDSIISMKNHMHNEPTNTWWSMAYIEESFYNKSDEEQLDFVIDYFVPWYINFYVSWYKACESNDFLWITYDQLINEKVNTINQVLKYYSINLEVDEKGLSDVEKKIFNEIRFNKGNSGRGRERLTTVQQDRVKKYFSYYPEVNFERIFKEC